MKTSMTWTDDGGGRRQDMDQQVLSQDEQTRQRTKGSLLVKSRQSLTLLMPFIFVSLLQRNRMSFNFYLISLVDTIIRANFLRVLLAQTGSPAH